MSRGKVAAYFIHVGSVSWQNGRGGGWAGGWAQTHTRRDELRGVVRRDLGGLGGLRELGGLGGSGGG